MANLPFFVSGVRGGHLATRIEEIVANRGRSELTRARRAALVFAAITLGIAPVVAGALMQAPRQQPPASERTRFEVASIKRTPEVTGPGADFSAMPGGRLHARNDAVSNFIGNVYGGVPHYLIANMPDWLTAGRYDLEAKAADSTATRPQLMLMLQTLLEDRFKLRWHRETREGPVYVLSVARGGHKLRASKDCVVERDPDKPLRRRPPAGRSHCAATTG